MNSQFDVEPIAAHLPDPPITVMREIRVQPGHEAQFEELMRQLMAVAVQQPGHLGATVVRPTAPGQAYRFVYKFDRLSSLQRWHASPRRAELFAPVAPLIESDRFDQHVGLETWFNLADLTLPAPPKWKTTLLSWIAIYPTVVAGIYALRAVNFKAAVPIQTLVLTVVVVPVVAYILAPWLGRRMHGWLHTR